MELRTTAEVISFAKRLEDESAKFYQDLSQKYSADGDIFLSFATENQKNIVIIERAYYGVITDAIEGCFAFNVNPDEYTLKIDLAENASYADAVNRAIEIEIKMVKFYSDAAEQSKSLMADVPRTFTIVAKKKKNRESKLRSLLNKE